MSLLGAFIGSSGRRRAGAGPEQLGRVTAYTVDLSTATQDDLDIDVTDCHELYVQFFDGWRSSLSYVTSTFLEGNFFDAGGIINGASDYNQWQWNASGDGIAGTGRSEFIMTSGTTAVGFNSYIFTGFSAGVYASAYQSAGIGDQTAAIVNSTTEILTVRVMKLANIQGVGKMQVIKILYEERITETAINFAVSAPTYQDMGDSHFVNTTYQNVNSSPGGRFQFTPSDNNGAPTTTFGVGSLLLYDVAATVQGRLTNLGQTGVNFSFSGSPHWGVLRHSNLNVADAILHSCAIVSNTASVNSRHQQSGPLNFTHLWYSNLNGGLPFDQGLMTTERLRAFAATHEKFSGSGSVSKVVIPVEGADRMEISNAGITLSSGNAVDVEVSYDGGSVYETVAVEWTFHDEAGQGFNAADNGFRAGEESTNTFIGLQAGAHVTQIGMGSQGTDAFNFAGIDTINTGEVTHIRYCSNTGSSITNWDIDVHRYDINAPWVAPAGTFAIPAGVPDPVIWYNPEYVTYGTGSEIATITNLGTGGAEYDAVAGTTKSTAVTDVTWGSRTVFKPAVGSELTFAPLVPNAWITIATYGDGTDTTFSSYAGLVDGNTAYSGLVGDTGQGSLFLNQPGIPILDGIDVPTQSTVLPLLKTTIGARNDTTTGNALNTLFADDFSTSRSWGNANGGTVGQILMWNQVLTAQQVADVSTALDDYYFTAPLPAFIGFRAEKSATSQTLDISQTFIEEIVFDLEIFDTLDAFANNRFTVPAAINGSYINFVAGMEVLVPSHSRIYLEVSTNGGGAWTTVSGNGDDANEWDNYASGPLLANTGDIYRMSFSKESGIIGSDPVMQNTSLTFFSGYVSTS